MMTLKRCNFDSLFRRSNSVTTLFPFPSISTTSPYSSSNDVSKNKTALTQEELTKINLLLPRLCLSNNLTTAIKLTSTALLTNPPPNCLSFSILIHSLTSLPDMTKSMSLLTILRHTPEAYHHLTPITTMLVTSYMRRKRPKEALKVYQWMLRPGSRCKVESRLLFGVLVGGLCGVGWVLEGLMVLKDMVCSGFLPGARLRDKVCRSLLREARVREAVELDMAFCCCFEDENGESAKKVVEYLDSVIRNWTD
ncbi:hypothetical protein K2173_020530 [Erythroxylum novogranatense]|uniref:Pentatricopeptide repeat-containing protein n=1 Tax=Erythroxylum novogranatense TaxID=1862640 RepID=A0AAV8TIK3_9ROSI|nr:hypothetical protein K2173_020530 [Erythroxylum novogranatense]